MEGIAVIGMSGRFPGAKNLDEFWENLKNGVESIKFFTEEELRNAGIDDDLISDPNYIRASGKLDDVDLFDADFFGYNPKEAEILDPQQRIFLECAKEAIDDAAYNPETFDGLIGVYAGTGGFNTYLFHSLLANKHLVNLFGTYQIFLGNEKDFLTTRASYKLNLKGPSVTVQTACSTSLMAVHMACQSLLSYQCDMALAGGVRVSIPQVTGYQYNEGFILSSDGHVRAFDAKASGTVPGEGVGIVMLKRLEDAIADRDNIHAIIKASAANNDGSLKAGFTAPSVEGQAEVIATAQAIAEVDPETISYIETHGTGTLVGDPIEITALTQAFRLKTNKKGFCAIGAVKCNIGHTDIAAGVAGLIKTILSIKNKAIPPSINYDTPNPAIDFDNSPFFVNTKLQDWKNIGSPRRAGVSAFGLGGTNVHVVLEEYQSDIIANASQRPSHLILLSAKSNSVLDKYSENLSTHLFANPKINIADVAYSLKVGRQNLPHRRMLVAETPREAAEALHNLDPEKVFTQINANDARSVVFMFPGQGAQYVNMGKCLYQSERVFSETVDHCAEYLKPHLELDIRKLLFPQDNNEETAKKLEQTVYTQPALFIIEYAQAQLLLSYDIKPASMIGHSIGDYVAACLAGIFSLEDALYIIAMRAKLMQKQEPGSMLSVRLSEAKVKEYLTENISLAAINSPNLIVLSGPTEMIKELSEKLSGLNIVNRVLYTSHAYHSKMMEPALKPFVAEFAKIKLTKPSAPFISSLTGTRITDEQATDPNFWASQLRNTVRFADGLSTILKEPNSIFLEVGPGRTLSTLAKQHPDKTPNQPVFSSLRHPNEDISDDKFLLNVLGRLWLSGINIDWSLYYANEKRFRLSLPPYPFEKKKYWIDSVKSSENRFADEDQYSLKKRKDIGDWFYIPSWKRSLSPDKVKSKTDSKEKFVFFLDDFGIGDTLSKKIIGDISVVRKGTEFSCSNSGYTLNPDNPEHYQQLIDDLIEKDFSPTAFVHLWNLTNQKFEVNDKNIVTGSFDSLLYLAQAIGQADFENEIIVSVISDFLHEIETGDVVDPVKSLLLGPVKVIPLEFDKVRCQSIDITLPEPNNNSNSDLINNLLLELTNPSSDHIIAYRGNKRYIESFEQVLINPVSDSRNILHDNGVYIITGGLGGVGLAIAKEIAQTVKAKLVLLSRSSFLKEEEWDNWLKSNNNENETSLKIKQIKDLKSLNSEVMILSANVAEEEQIRDVIIKVKERFGQINGVVHSAGVLNDGIIQLKTKEAVESVFSPKVKGTLVLNELLKDEKLDFFVLCSALSTATGSLAQIDYISANAFLNAFAHQNSTKNKINTIAINWGTWKDVGLAAKIFAQGSNRNLITQKETKLDDHPLIEFEVEDDSVTKIFRTEYQQGKHWVLDEHKVTNGGAIIPGTGYLEIIRAASEHLFNSSHITIEDVIFLYPFTVDENQSKDLFIKFETSGDSEEFTIYSTIEHVKGRVKIEKLSNHKIIDIEKKIRNDSYKEIDSSVIKQEGHLELGPRWKNLKKLFIGKEEAVGVLELSDEFADDLKNFKLHPALLDVATGCAMPLVEGFSDGKDFFVALSYGKIEVLNPFTKKIFSDVKYRKDLSNGKDTETFDVTIINEDGQVALWISSFTMKRIGSKDLISKKISKNKVEIFNEKSVRPQLENTILDIAIKGGMTSEEGAEAFSRIINRKELAHILVSPLDLNALKFKVEEKISDSHDKPDENLAEQNSITVHSRPNLATSYVAPDSELEENLVGIWEEILGIGEIGVYDDFFELGGHSLMFTQVLSRLKKITSVSISLKNLFDKPTIRGIAEKILEKGKEKTSKSIPKLKKVSRENFGSKNN